MARCKTYSLCTLYTIFCCKWTLIHSLIQKWNVSTFWKTGSIELGCCLYLFHVVVWIISAATIFGGQHSWDDQNIPDDYIKASLYFSVGGCGSLCNRSNFLLHKNIDCKKILCDIKTPTTLSLFTFQSFSQILQISVVWYSFCSLLTYDLLCWETLMLGKVPCWVSWHMMS